MTDTSATGIDTDAVAAHLADSARIGDELSATVTTVKALEARVSAASSIGPDPMAETLAEVVGLWRDHDARLQTILDALATVTTGPAGPVSLPTQDLRDLVAAANGPTNRGSFEIRDDGLDLIIDGQAGRDTIVVTQNADGTATVEVNGVAVALTEDEFEHLVVLGGTGDDTITVTPYSPPVMPTPVGPVVAGAETSGVRIDGGDGNDILTGGRGDDTIVGGGGRDYIDGGHGNDHLEGGDGFDVIYGGRGEDHLIGGADNDYLDGGRGDDIVSGRGGDDIVAGGDGDDDVFGGAGDDTLIAGRGEDTIYDNHAGDRDRVFAQAEDGVSIDDGNAANVDIFEVYDPDTSQIRTSGTLEERDRIQSDLDTLASIPEGAAVLESIDTNAGGHTVTIGIDATDGSTASPASSAGTYEFGGVNGNDSDGAPNADVGQDGTVSYNPTTTRLYDSKPDEDWHDTPPVVILHHELLHTEDYVRGARDPGLSQQVEHDGNGNPVPSGPGAAPPAVMTYPPVVQPDGTVVADPIPPRNNRELSVVGLPFDEDDRLNSEPAAPATEVDPNTRQHTENSLRDQLGLPRRRYY